MRAMIVFQRMIENRKARISAGFSRFWVSRKNRAPERAVPDSGVA